MACHNEEYLFEFPSFPSISLEERRRLTYTTYVIFACTSAKMLSIEGIERNLYYNIPFNPACQEKYLDPYYGPYKTTLEEFLSLPEISCIVYHVNVMDRFTNTPIKKYISYIDVLNHPRNKFHNFRFCIVQAVKTALENGLGKKFGSISIEDLCDTFNNCKAFYKAFGWKLHNESTLSFLNNHTLLNTLCTLCSRELVIRISSTTTRSATIRLRNHPDYLCEKQIEPERVLADKALNFYFKYHQDNPDNFEWDIDIRMTNFQFQLDENPMTSYRGKYLDNIYGALHYTNSVHDLRSLASTITRYTQSRLCARTHHEIALDTDVNMLLDMTSANGLAPLQYWEKEKIDLYFKIADELTQQITAIDRNYVYNFIELTPNKSGFLMYYSNWAFKKMAKHILYVTCRSKYQSAGKIAVSIKSRFKYDINKWLKLLNFPSVEDLFELEELKDRLNAICVRIVDEKKIYRNMESVMEETNVYHGFPFTARKRILNCLEEAKLSKIDTNGFINEAILMDIYLFSYKKNLDSAEKVKLFGKDYDTVSQFVKEYFCKEITVETCLKTGEPLYSITGEFEDAYNMVLKEKKNCYESVKFWKGMRIKDIERSKFGPQSAFSLWKLGNLNYDDEIHKAQRCLMTKRR